MKLNYANNITKMCLLSEISKMFIAELLKQIAPNIEKKIQLLKI